MIDANFGKFSWTFIHPGHEQWRKYRRNRKLQGLFFYTNNEVLRALRLWRFEIIQFKNIADG